MIRTTTTIRGSRIQRAELAKVVGRVSDMVEAADANGRGYVEVQLEGRWHRSGASTQDKVSATVKVWDNA